MSIFRHSLKLLQSSNKRVIFNVLLTELIPFLLDHYLFRCRLYAFSFSPKVLTMGMMLLCLPCLHFPYDKIDMLVKECRKTPVVTGSVGKLYQHFVLLLNCFSHLSALNMFNNNFSKPKYVLSFNAVTEGVIIVFRYTFNLSPLVSSDA